MAQITINNGDTGATVRSDLNGMFTDLYADTRGAVAYKSFYIDGNRTDGYTADGTILRPFKTISALVGSGLITAASSITLAPATYTEAASVTLPNYPLVVYGNGSTISITGSCTIPNATFSHYDINTVTTTGVIFSSSSAGRVLIQGGSITGNITLNGLTDMKSCTLLSGTITANSTAQFLAIVCTFTSQVTGAGKIILENDIFNTSKSSALVTSASGGELIFVNNLLTNLGTGGGISCANGATTLPNMISNNVLTVASGAPVACGTAVTIYSNNVLAGGTNTGTGYISVNSDYPASFVTAPASKTAAGFPGQYASDGTYWYLCTAVNTWIRGTLSMASW